MNPFKPRTYKTKKKPHLTRRMKCENRINMLTRLAKKLKVKVPYSVESTTKRLTGIISRLQATIKEGIEKQCAEK